MSRSPLAIAAHQAVTEGKRDLGSIMDHLEARGVFATPSMIDSALRDEHAAGRIHKTPQGGWSHKPHA